jgi:hypothetical protein
MARKKAAVEPKNYGPRFDYWGQFETLTVGEVALMMKGIDPRLETELPLWADTDTENEIRMLTGAVREGTLVGYPDGSGIPKLTTDVSVSSLITWLRSRGYVMLADGLDAARSARSQDITSGDPGHIDPSPTAAALPGSATANTSPPPLTTTDVAVCFGDLKWSSAEWKKPLGDKPVWLSKCLVVAGERGVRETRWNPVLIGAALVQQGHVKANSVRARFQTKDPLKPWLDEWKTYEADHLDSQ